MTVANSDDDRLALRHVGRHGERLRAERVDLAGDLVEHLLAAAGKHEVVAGLGERNGHRPAHAGSCSGHQRNFCGSHRMSFLVREVQDVRNIIKARARHHRWHRVVACV